MFTISPTALTQAAKLGFDPAGAQTLVDQSSPVTHERANRRCEDFMFVVEEGVVTSFLRFDASRHLHRYSEHHPNNPRNVRSIR